MKLTHCKLDKKLQVRLLEFFVTQVTARAAADLLQIQPNSAALFYRKVRQIITWHLQQQTAEQFDGQVELDGSYFGGVRKRKMGRATANKVIVFGILKRGGKVYTLVVENRRTQSLLPVIKKKSSRTASYIQTFFAAMMCWISALFTINGSITSCCSLKGETTLTGLKISGVRPNVP